MVTQNQHVLKQVFAAAETLGKATEKHELTEFTTTEIKDTFAELVKKHSS